MATATELSGEQRIALGDAYTTLRGVRAIFGETDEVIASLCARSESLLVGAFPELAFLENFMDGGTWYRPGTQPGPPS